MEHFYKDRVYEVKEENMITEEKKQRVHKLFQDLISKMTSKHIKNTVRALYEKAKKKMDKDEDPDDIIHRLHDQAKEELTRRANLN